MKNVLITTDGACIGNPGPGGWACILRSGRVVREMYGSEPRTTNNRMELRAVIEGLRALREPCQVTVYTDSEYVRKGVTEWLERWKLNGWKKRDKGKVVNQDLWVELDQAAQQQQRIRWEWVRGHANHADNLRCDFLANRAAREQISSRGSTQPVEANPGVETHQHASRLRT
jgi:ribonuclease HI